MLDEERVHRDPVAGVDPLPKRRLGLIGRTGPDDAEAVGDPVDVGVDRDRRDPIPEDQHAVRGLRSDARQRDERVVLLRDLAAEPVEDLASDPTDHPGLHPVEPGHPDQRLDLRRPSVGQGLRVREPGEQLRAGGIGVGVPRPLREDGADQDLERVLGVVAQVRAAPVAGMIERREAIEQPFPIELRGPGPPRQPLALPSRPGVAGATAETPGSERSGSSVSSAPRSSSPTR